MHPYDTIINHEIVGYGIVIKLMKGGGWGGGWYDPVIRMNANKTSHV